MGTKKYWPDRTWRQENRLKCMDALSVHPLQTRFQGAFFQRETKSLKFSRILGYEKEAI